MRAARAGQQLVAAVFFCKTAAHTHGTRERHNDKRCSAVIPRGHTTAAIASVREREEGHAGRLLLHVLWVHVQPSVRIRGDERATPAAKAKATPAAGGRRRCARCGLSLLAVKSSRLYIGWGLGLGQLGQLPTFVLP